MFIDLICYTLISYLMFARSFKSYDGTHTVSIGMNSRSLDKLLELLLVRIEQKSYTGGSTTHTILVNTFTHTQPTRHASLTDLLLYLITVDNSLYGYRKGNLERES